MAADHLYELGLGRDQIYARAVELEGHPDNVGAALYGGFVLCPPAARGEPPAPLRLAPPEGLEAVLGDPRRDRGRRPRRGLRCRPRSRSRTRSPTWRPQRQLVLGIERSDLALIARGLSDRLHQPARRALYERSMALVERAGELGALGATISGAGPAVMLWCDWQGTGKVVEAATAATEGWAEVRRVGFTALGR